ncbi:MAG: MEDS domain-containing protein [Bacillota bacterium]
MEAVEGIHSAFYYYGIEHLIVNLYYYFSNYSPEGSTIYLSTGQELYDEIKDQLADHGLFENVVNHYSINQLIKKCGKNIENLKEQIIEEERINNNEGINWIVEVDYSIKNTSERLFLEWEEGLTEVFSETKSSMLCLYDFEDYINEQKYIDSRIIEKSFRTHPYTLYQFSIEKTKKLQKIY